MHIRNIALGHWHRAWANHECMGLFDEDAVAYEMVYYIYIYIYIYIHTYMHVYVL